MHKSFSALSCYSYTNTTLTIIDVDYPVAHRPFQLGTELYFLGKTFELRSLVLDGLLISYLTVVTLLYSYCSSVCGQRHFADGRSRIVTTDLTDQLMQPTFSVHLYQLPGDKPCPSLRPESVSIFSPVPKHLRRITEDHV